jgi:indolepyruvate ferredoxin oxidoreductase beta subunit
LVRTGTAHFLLSLEENEGYRNLPFLSKGARMYVNTNSRYFPRQEIKNFLDKREIIYHSVAAADIAQELGAPRSSNLALLGFFSAFDEGPINYKEINLKVFEVGYTKGKDFEENIFD